MHTGLSIKRNQPNNSTELNNSKTTRTITSQTAVNMSKTVVNPEIPKNTQIPVNTESFYGNLIIRKNTLDKLKKPMDIDNIETMASKKMDLFTYIINKNLYVDACFSESNRDVDSFYYLVDRQISHSDTIKLGITVEKIFRDVINMNPNLTDIKEKNKINVSEKDHLFLDKTNNKIYYAEVKGNLNLDTEKKYATRNKMEKIVKELKENYPGYTIQKYLFAPRYVTTELIPERIKKLYKSTKYADFITYFIGVNDYLQALGIPYQFTSEDTYKKMINDLVNRLFVCVTFKDLQKEGINRTNLGYTILETPTSPPQLQPKRLHRRFNSNNNLKTLTVNSPMKIYYNIISKKKHRREHAESNEMEKDVLQLPNFNKPISFNINNVDNGDNGDNRDNGYNGNNEGDDVGVSVYENKNITRETKRTKMNTIIS
jgi:hypothetical protein